MENWRGENESPEGAGNSLMSGKSAAGKWKVFVRETREAATDIPLVVAQREERKTLPAQGEAARRGWDGPAESQSWVIVPPQKCWE